MTMIRPASKNKLIALTALAAVVTVLFSFLGAPLLRVLRNVGGATLYWTSGAVATLVLAMLGLGPIAFLLIGIWVCIGVYGEFEDRGKAGFAAAFWSVFLGTVLSVAGPWLLLQWTGINLNEILHQSLDNILKQMPSTQEPSSWLSGVKIDAQFLINQLPSMMAILVLSSLAFALILDRRVAFLAGLRFERAAAGIRLLEFRMPDFMVWVAMFSFLLSFLKMDNPWVSVIALNIFTVMVGAYFFQGLAVLESAFAHYRIGFLIRLLIYVFVVGQLFFLLSVVGLVDYWVDFRRRMRGNSLPEKDQNNKEHV